MMLGADQKRRSVPVAKSTAIVAGLVLCLASLVGCALLREWFNLPASYAVSGRVVDCDTGEGISGVLIQFDGAFGTATTEHDGTYTKEGLKGRVTATPSKAGVLVFDPETLVLTGATAKADFKVVLTTQRLEGITQAAGEVDGHVGALYDPGRQADSLAAIAAVAREIEGVEWAESDDSSVSVMYRYGGVQVWLVTPLPEPLESSTAPAMGDAKRTGTLAGPQAVVGNRRAVIVDAVYGDPRYETTRQYLKQIRVDLERIGFDVDSWDGPDATVEKMRTLADYGFVFVQGHGNVLETPDGWLTTLQTGEMTALPAKWYEWAPPLRYLLEWWRGRLVIMEELDPAHKRGFWGVTSKFFEAYTMDYPQSVFIAWNCSGLSGTDLAEALRAAGVQAYVGWTEEHAVHTQLARDLVKVLACGGTIEDALVSIRPALGRWYPDMIDSIKVHPETGKDARLVPAGTCLLWDARAPMPTPRAWAPAVAYGDKIYVVGGVSCTSACHQFRNPSNALEAYDPATNTWERLPPMPTPRVGPAVAALNGKIYVMGGFNREQGTEFAATVRRMVEIYDIAARSWTRGPDMLELRAWGRAVALGRKVYVLGGVGYTYHSGVEVLDPQTNTWSRRAPFAGGRYLHAAATANGRIYVIGGGKHEPDYTYSDIQEYDPTTDSWRARSPMPSPAGVNDAAVVGNRIWVFGGTGFCRVYDLATNLWEDRNSEHSSDGSFSVAHLNGLVYKFGGGGWGPTLDMVEATRLP